MDKRPLAMLIISMISLFLAFAYSYMNPLGNFLSFLPLTFLVLGFFLLGAIFFGYLSFIPHIFYGLALGSEKNALVFIYVLPLAVATYAGAKLGFALEKDFKLEEYFLSEGKSVLIMLVFAVALALLIEFAMPVFLGMIPKEFFGLAPKEGESVLGVFGDMNIP